MYKGEKCMENFLLYLRRQADEIEDILSNKQKKMCWGREAQERANRKLPVTCAVSV